MELARAPVVAFHASGLSCRNDPKTRRLRQESKTRTPRRPAIARTTDARRRASTLAFGDRAAHTSSATCSTSGGRPGAIEVVLHVSGAAMHRPQLMPHRWTLRRVLVDDKSINEVAHAPTRAHGIVFFPSGGPTSSPTAQPIASRLPACPSVTRSSLNSDVTYDPSRSRQAWIRMAQRVTSTPDRSEENHAGPGS
jgi:hypothetical protein